MKSARISRTNLVQEKKYSDRLLETLRRYHNRAIETAQVIEELISMAKDFQEALKRNEAARACGPMKSPSTMHWRNDRKCCSRWVTKP